MAEQQKISRERLLAESQAYARVPRYVMAGALAGSREKEFTQQDARRLVDAFLKRPVEGSDQ